VQASTPGIHVQPSDPDNEASEYHCLQCDYDLRGHEGDLRVCPECGFANKVQDLSDAAELADKDIDQHESAPTVAILTFWLIALGLFLMICGYWIAGAVFALPGSAIWVWAVSRFNKRFHWRPGCWETLGWFHLTAALIVLGLLGIGMLTSWVDDSAVNIGGKWASTVPLLLLVLVSGRIKKAISRTNHPYKIARKKLRRLAILTAVEERRRGRT